MSARPSQGSQTTMLADDDFRRLKRAMTAFTQATEALMRATDEQALLEEVCKIVVDVAGYPLAWVGYAAHDHYHSVIPRAVSGQDNGYVETARISWDEGNPRGRGPTGTAIRTGEIVVAHDTTSDINFGPWRAAAAERGFSSTISLPLSDRDRVFGALCIYATETEAFDQEETRLLADLARNLSYGITVIRAQTAQRRAQRQLEESEERYRSLVELAPDAIMVHGDGRVLFINRAAERIFRVSTERPVLDRLVLELIHPKDRALITARLRARVVPNETAAVTMLRTDGTTFEAEIRSSATTFNGVPARQTIIRDVSERNAVQAQLIQTAKLATLGEMAAGMAHELSQPINIIRMAAEATQMFIARGKATQDYQEKQFDLIASQAARMAEIIDHIRIFSRSDSGQPCIFDAVTTVRQAIELLERQFTTSDIRLEVDLPKRPCPVSGRPVQVEQVVINLLSNALDAVRELKPAARAREPGWQGRVKVQGKLEGRGKRLVIAISDNGPGIPPAMQDRIFEPFFTTKEVGRGTGLGLSVSFGIISSMQGKLETRNAREGAVFAITLPVAAGTRVEVTEEPHRASQPAPHANGRHVLVVDDEPEAVEAMAGFLKEMGYRVSLAASGNSAFKRFLMDPADVVVTDIRMPNGDGTELVRRLREVQGDLPIIVVTGHMGMTEDLAYLADDQAVVLKKPLSLKALRDHVERFTATRAANGQ